MRSRLLVVVLCCLLFSVAAAPAYAVLEFGSTVTGDPNSEQVVYDYDCVFPVPPAGQNQCTGTPPAPNAGINSCNRQHFADLPVRAFRFKNEAGAERFQITMGANTQNRRLVGTTLGTVVPEKQLTEEQRACGADITFRAHKDNDPAKYQQWEYIASPYVEDEKTFPADDPNHGRKVYGFFHEEFHGGTVGAPTYPYCDEEHRANEPGNCWMSGTVFSTSTDGGRCYAPTSLSGSTCVWNDATRASSQRVASLPDKYTDVEYSPATPDGGKHWGHRGHGDFSNIVYDEAHGYFYFFVRSHSVDPTQSPPWDDPLHDKRPAYRNQQQGVCLVRTQDIAQPSSWRAWDGTGNSAWDAGGFSVDFVNPYDTGAPPPARHRCQPVASDVIGGLSYNLTFNTYFGKYMLVGMLTRGPGANGFYYSLSSDLVHWSQPQLLLSDDTCAGYPIVYPSIIDPADPAANPASDSRNFDHPGRSPYLYYTRLCRGANPDRDLVRIPLTFNGPAGDPAFAPVSKRYMEGERVHFQPWGSRRPAGYSCDPADSTQTLPCDSFGEGISDMNVRVNRIDGGAPFDQGRGFGWVRGGTSTPLNITPNMVDRGNLEAIAYQEKDTFAYMNPPDSGPLEAPDMERAEGAWEMAVPQGKYVVTGSVGDPAGNVGSDSGVRAEGSVLILPGSITLPQTHAVGYVTVDVCDGRLTIKEHEQAVNTKLNWVDSWRVGSATCP